MSTVKEIITLCKAGQVLEAYDTAKADLASSPCDVWAQRAMGWTLYYMIKDATEYGDTEKIQSILEELNSLDELNTDDDVLIYDNVLFKVAEFVKNKITPNSPHSFEKLSKLFHALRDIKFKPSKAYSFLLQGFMRNDMWPEFIDFLEWWNLDNLTSEDYKPYVTESGKKMMTLAERVFIANAKVLLKQTHKERIETFLPRLESLVEKHPEMMYPGYFYGKLLIALGRDRGEALKVLLPFARKKIKDFWVWQLLSEVYSGDGNMQLACLLRAVNCKSQETFLGKVRCKLVSLYLQRGQYGKARYHADRVVDCHIANKWPLTSEMEQWIHQPWMTSVEPDAKEDIDYMKITNTILCLGTEESIAIVSYIDPKTQRISLIFGHKQRMYVKLRFHVRVGSILKVYYTKDAEDKIQLIQACKHSLPSEGLSYIKKVDGIIDKKPGNVFAFLKVENTRFFISPRLVQQYNLQNATRIRAIAALDYEKKKDQWSWTCIDVVR